MKRKASSLLLALMALALLDSPALSQTLKVATLVPDGTAWMREMRKSAETIKERTGGKVRFKFYPGGVMGNDKSVLRKMRVGQLQGGAVSAVVLADIYPDSQIYGLPMLFGSYDEVDYVRSRMDRQMMKGLEQRGYVAFGIVEGGFAYLMSKRPVLKVEDLKGLKIWVPEGDPISRIFFEAAGRSPIPLALSDVLTGLQTGLIETIGTPAIGAIALQWHTAVKYLTDTPLMYTYGMLVIDRRAFMRLRPEDQVIVQEVLGERIVELNKQNRKDNINAKKVLSNHGITFVRPSQEDLDQLRSIAAEATRRLAAKKLYTPSVLEALRLNLSTYQKQNYVGSTGP